MTQACPICGEPLLALNGGWYCDWCGGWQELEDGDNTPRDERAHRGDACACGQEALHDGDRCCTCAGCGVRHSGIYCAECDVLVDTVEIHEERVALWPARVYVKAVGDELFAVCGACR